jgi:pimeloyl-CoA synthetase
LGYQVLDADMHAFTGDYFAVLALGSRIIDDESMQIKMKTMSEEERKKQQLIITNREAYQAKAKADAAHKKTLQENSMKDRAEKAKEIQPSSVGNKLNFGANMVKFEPPSSGG